MTDRTDPPQYGSTCLCCHATCRPTNEPKLNTTSQSPDKKGVLLALRLQITGKGLPSSQGRKGHLSTLGVNLRTSILHV